MRSAALTALLVLGLAGCAPGVGFAPAWRDCASLLRDYDVALRLSNGGFGRRDLTLATNVSRTAQLARQGGCVTDFGDDPLALAALARELGPAAESGAPIRPVTLQFGIVPGAFAEYEARRFFGALGYRVRSRGAPGLGRRVGVGPIATEGGLAQAAEAARRAGFPAPYPWRF